MKILEELQTLDIPRQDYARLLYFLGLPQKDIAKITGFTPARISQIKKEDDWDNLLITDRVEMMTEWRYYHLLFKESKSNTDFKEMNHLTSAISKWFTPKKRGKRGPYKKKGMANVNSSDFDVEDFKKKAHEKYMDELFPYQRAYVEKTDNAFKSKKSSGESMLLKGRQIGFTKTLGESSLMRLCDTGHNQIFIASSLRQSFQAREYIKDFVQDVTGKRMQGTETLHFWDGLKIDFLASNFRTAQGYSGDVTIDEFLWMQNFDELTTFVSGCATLSQYNIRYSSTASYKSHPGYLKWIGHEWNRRNKDNPIPIDHASLKEGLLCEDGIFRQIITTPDAVEQGNPLINLDRLKRRYDEDDYNNLFLAQFIDNSQSFFNTEQIQSCMVDSYFDWDDFFLEERPHKPYDNRPVVIGYDPAQIIHSSACVVMALPTKEHPYHRILETFDWHGTDYVEQAENLKKLTERYNVQHISIDRTGVGVPVGDMVKRFFHNVTFYSRTSFEQKTFLVLAAKNMFRDKKIKFDSGEQDIVKSFAKIKLKATRSDLPTFATDNEKERNHADKAWAIMYALGYLQTDGSNKAVNEVRSSVI